MIADYERALREHRIDLVRRNGEILGLIEMIFKTDHLLIENVAVQPKCQGQGLGRRLLAHAEAVAAAEGYGTIRLFTNKLFRVNLKLYAGLGFGTDREEPFKGGTKVWMSKAINVAP
ncbi:Acetyltransferase (GNAT) family protein [Arboricoccus pini]|uniref:Acetyltransferase (GNAT) family protein n=2 Tax=Arboricoccus pini TaxID=1963835 RepID=A0A212Q703_9PROT|nr:Acetyltransferase (GNAT) family protein [Arboricoccus pini]